MDGIVKVDLRPSDPCDSTLNLSTKLNGSNSANGIDVDLLKPGQEPLRKDYTTIPVREYVSKLEEKVNQITQKLTAAKKDLTRQIKRSRKELHEQNMRYVELQQEIQEKKYLPLANMVIGAVLGITVSAGLSVAYMEYKNEKNAAPILRNDENSVIDK